MKKFGLFFVSLIIAIILFGLHRTYGNEIHEVKATAYCYNSGQTATGTIPEEGRTLAGKREWFGKVVVVWENKGNGIEPQNYIGTYICEDTGGKPIQKGYVVDVFIKEEQDAKVFGCKDVIIQIIDSEG